MIAHLSLVALPAGFFVGLLPHGYRVFQSLRFDKYDNAKGRAAFETSKQKMPAEVQGRVDRATNAHNNFYENYPIFIGAILAANVTKVPLDTINQYAIAWLALRMLYNWAYIYGTTQLRANIRSLSYVLSTGGMISLMFQAASSIN